MDVEHLMRELEDDVRRARRTRLLARGAAPEYRDPAVYERVDALLRRALETRDFEALLIPDLVDSETDVDLDMQLRFSSHRPVIGPFLLFVKKHILLPLTFWLYEYSLENFRKQQRINRVLFACIEELALENARLRLAQTHASATPEGRAADTRPASAGAESSTTR